MADQEDAGTPLEGAAPPKQMPFKPMAAAPSGEREKHTVMIKRPMLRRPGEVAPASQPVAGMGVPVATPATAPAGVPVSMSDAAKRKTTRVDLPEMHPPGNAEGVDEFKTVKLRPMSAPQPGSSPLPDGPKPLSPSQVQAAKSKTSRISLEAAFGANEGLLDSNAPKTIRLKRPSELSTGTTGPISVTVATAKKTSMMPPVTPPSQQSITAKLPTQTLNAAALTTEEDNSPTRRKTIKIKRPSAAAGIKINVAQTEGEGEETGETTEDGMQRLAVPGGFSQKGATGPDTANIAFILSAVAALIATLGVIWILAAQAFGPNAAVTGYTALLGADIAPPPGLVTID